MMSDRPKLGDAGNAVRALHERLLAAEFAIDAAETEAAVFGPQTRAAVIAYQRHNGLPDTASLDVDTMARLNGGATTNYGSSGASNNNAGAQQ